MRRFENKPAKSLRHLPNWIRTGFGSEEELKALAESYLARAINPIVITPDGLILDGNRRIASIMSIGKGDVEVPCCFTDEPVTECMLLEIQLDSAEFTKSLTPYEKAVGNQRWLELNPGKTAKDLAERRRRSPASISYSLSLWKCEKAVQSAAKEGKISESDWYAFSKLTPDEQLVMLTKRLSGEIGSRDELERQGRKRRNGAKNGKAVRIPKVTVPLPSGTTMVLKDRALSMGELVEDLTYALKSAKEAETKERDIKTWMSICRDEAGRNRKVKITYTETASVVRDKA